MAPEIERDGKLYSWFEYRIERPIVLNYPYILDSFFPRHPPAPGSIHNISVMAWLEGYEETKKSIQYPRPPDAKALSGPNQATSEGEDG
jgi:hypothetical protein